MWAPRWLVLSLCFCGGQVLSVAGAQEQAPCEKPPSDAYTTDLQAYLEARVPAIKKLAVDATLGFRRKAEKIYGILPGVYNFRVLEYTFCSMYRRGDINHAQYLQLVQYVLPIIVRDFAPSGPPTILPSPTRERTLPRVVDSAFEANTANSVVAPGDYVPVPGQDSTRALQVTVRVPSRSAVYQVSFTYRVKVILGLNNTSALFIYPDSQPVMRLKATVDQASDFFFRDSVLVHDLPRRTYVFRVMNYATGPDLKERRFIGYRNLIVIRLR